MGVKLARDCQNQTYRGGEIPCAIELQFAVPAELGQHVNKTATHMTIRHAPTGQSVTASDSRSPSMNLQLVEAKRRRGETKKLRGRVG